MTLHRSEYIDQKRKIGLLVASLVTDGETLIPDAGIRLTTPSFAGLRLKEAMIKAARASVWSPTARGSTIPV